MKNYNQIKDLPFRELKGISQKTTENHYQKLYHGYVKKWQEVQEKLKNADRSLANASFSELRSLKMEETFLADAIILHEAFFDILGGEGKPEGEILKAIEREFGSFQNWQEEFKALGLTARGWVILAFDFNDGRLHNYICDAHNQGSIWGASPILALDVYDHAYFIDYGADRKSYINDFFSNLNWKVINKKFQKITKK
jgi:Fe-Mn family superoxide dismutase